MNEIMASNRWTTNGHLIADVAQLGFIGDHVLDLTYGKGTFWSQWVPARLVTNDPHRPEADWHYDARTGPWSDEFDTVVFDPPYMLNGTPSLGEFDERYGVEVPRTIEQRRALLEEGASAALTYTKPGGTVLVKCMDQVASGRMQWQTDWVTNRLSEATKIARFNLLITPRPQRGPQQHPRNNYSTLLVFRKPR